MAEQSRLPRLLRGPDKDDQSPVAVEMVPVIPSASAPPPPLQMVYTHSSHLLRISGNTMVSDIFSAPRAQLPSCFPGLPQNGPKLGLVLRIRNSFLKMVSHKS